MFNKVSQMCGNACKSVTSGKTLSNAIASYKTRARINFIKNTREDYRVNSQFYFTNGIDPTTGQPRVISRNWRRPKAAMPINRKSKM